MLQFLQHNGVTGCLLARIAIQTVVCAYSKLDRHGVAKSKTKCNRNKCVDVLVNTQAQKYISVVYFCL
jgi:hypothetical protein